MPKRFRQMRERGGHGVLKKITWGLMVFAIMMSFARINCYKASAVGCPDLKVLFARGSGGERYTNNEYLAFRGAMEEKLTVTGLTYEFDDLDYPAVSIDVMDGHLGTILGAYVGGGDAYDFGDSVRKGTNELLQIINNGECRNTKYVLAGYSQGTMVLLNGLNEIDPGKIVYVATFGDPKLYLPEGAGLVPAACAGRNLSNYRIYVPDCRAHKGILGAREPYISDAYFDKVGTWCNKRDIMCSSHFSVNDHTSYAEAGLFEDASRFIMSKIGEVYGIRNQYTSPHDTAILIDSTGSMAELIDQYKQEALRLAQKTLDAGGRVALYDYRDLAEGYVPVERCSFETCSLESFQAGLETIVVDGGGDTPESLLSASFRVMKQLKWKFGSTKSLVILTDAGYHSPDLDGTTFYDVQKLSKQIDPVNIYVITTDSELDSYRGLAEATGGAVASSLDDLGIITQMIMEKVESLPRVEEEFGDADYGDNMPEVSIIEAKMISATEAKISFKKNSTAVMVFLNDGLVGTTYENEITIGELRTGIKNIITLVPLAKTARGEAVMVELEPWDDSQNDVMNNTIRNESNNKTVTIPKAPNTGRL